MRISMIVATAKNGVIGKDNALPWHLPADLKYFKFITMGKPIVMGRKTFDSIGRPLPGRQNIVITRDTSWHADGITIIHDVEDLVSVLDDPDANEVMIIGGAQIYNALIDKADRLYITEVDLDVDGDAFFPKLKKDEWTQVSCDPHPAQDSQPSYSFIMYERASN